MPEPTPAPKTKVCENCDAIVGESEKACPKCGVDFEELADTISSVEKANVILEKRKKNQPPTTEPPPPAAPAKSKSKLRGLGALLRKKA